MLKFEITEYDANVRAGLVQNDVFAKALRMLADPYKCLKNVAIDCHPHYRILENALRMFRTLTNAVTNNTKHLTNGANVYRMLTEFFSFFYSFANIVTNNIRNHPQCQGA